LTIFVVSISLLYHTSLISTYIWGFDAHSEYFIANLVKNVGFWNSTLPYPHNSLLILSIVAPVYSILCDLNLVWVFKAIFQIFFSLAPVAIYKLYSAYIGCKYEVASILSTSSFIRAVDIQTLAQLFLGLNILLVIEIVKISVKNY